MKSLLTTVVTLFRKTGFELIMVFLVLLVANNYTGRSDVHIGSADGMGYYDYLPSTFIHKDLVRKDHLNVPSEDIYRRMREKTFGIYVNSGRHMLNKYHVGTATLQLPFFMTAYFVSERASTFDDGYQQEFQNAILVAALFYLFLGLYFLKKTLLMYDVKILTIRLLQLVILFGTPLLHYSYVESAYSHVYSFFAITLFAYLVRSFFLKHSFKLFFLIVVVLGLIVLIRQLNFLVVVTVPFLAGSFLDLKKGIQFLFSKPTKLLIGSGLFVTIISIQFLFFYLQTGKPFVFSYQGESFNFLEPHLVEILFGFKRGLFVYTPVLILSLIALIYLLYKKEYFATLTWFFFFGTLTFVLSSWWSWYFGCSFGHRAYIDYYVFFMIPAGIMLTRLKLARFVGIPFMLVCLLLNLIQNYQYNHFIMHWCDMDFNKYKKVFLKTNPKYIDFVWKELNDLEALSHIMTLKEKEVPASKIDNHSIEHLFMAGSDLPDLIRISFVNNFDESSNSIVAVILREEQTQRELLYIERPIIYFHTQDLNHWHAGEADFVLPKLQNHDTQLRLIVYFDFKQQQSDLKEVEVSLYRDH